MLFTFRQYTESCTFGWKFFFDFVQLKLYGIEFGCISLQSIVIAPGLFLIWPTPSAEEHFTTEYTEDTEEGRGTREDGRWMTEEKTFRLEIMFAPQENPRAVQRGAAPCGGFGAGLKCHAEGKGQGRRG